MSSNKSLSLSWLRVPLLLAMAIAVALVVSVGLPSTTAQAGPGPVSASIFYDYDVIAMTGQAGLIGIEDGVSINDNATVALVGQLAGAEGVFVGNGTSGPTNITPSFGSGIDYTPAVQINNENKVVANQRFGLLTALRVWDGNSPDTFETVATGQFGNPGIFFNAVFSHPSIGNNGDVVFSAIGGSLLNCSFTCLATPDGPFNPFFPRYHEVATGTPVRPLIADDGRIAVRAGNTPASPIVLYDNDLTLPEPIAASSSLGQSPGVSDVGSIVVFAGDLSNGPGIFASIDDGSGSPRTLVTVAGEVWDASTLTCQEPELGFDDAGDPLCLSSFDIDSRVAVAHLQLGAPGIDGDSFVVAFIATPNAASSGTFTEEKGLWTVRVDVERQLEEPMALEYQRSGPQPAAQVGDEIADRVLTDIGVYDQIANAETDDEGNSRSQSPGEHRLAFWASTTSGEMAVRASHLGPPKFVIFLEGINTDLTSEERAALEVDCELLELRPGAHAEGEEANPFHAIKSKLISQGFQCSDFLHYSYTGGTVHPNGDWEPNTYDCDNTGQPLGLGVQHLSQMIEGFVEKHPNAEFHLVGHSLGGVVAAGTLDAIIDGTIPEGRVRSIITLDAPLNHVSSNTRVNLARRFGPLLPFLEFFFCPIRNLIRSAVAAELSDVTDRNRAMIRSELEENTKKAQARGAMVSTFGNEQDCLWDLNLCTDSIWADDTDTQLIFTASSHPPLFQLGTSNPRTGVPCTNIRCIEHSHSLIFHASTPPNDAVGAVAAAIGEQ